MSSEAEPVQEWVFTFGAGHRGYAARDVRYYGDTQLAARGFRLDDRYVAIKDTWNGARQRMIEMFGLVWCGQYSARDEAGVTEYGLTELVITDDSPDTSGGG